MDPSSVQYTERSSELLSLSPGKSSSAKKTRLTETMASSTGRTFVLICSYCGDDLYRVNKEELAYTECSKPQCQAKNHREEKEDEDLRQKELEKNFRPQKVNCVLCGQVLMRHYPVTDEDRKCKSVELCNGRQLARTAELEKKS